MEKKSITIMYNSTVFIREIVDIDNFDVAIAARKSGKHEHITGSFGK